MGVGQGPWDMTTTISLDVASRPTRTQKLKRILSRLQAATPDVVAAAVVSDEGRILASRMPEGLDRGRIAAMSAALLSMAERAAEDVGGGELEQLLLKCSDVVTLITSAGPRGMLVALNRNDARLGLVLLETSRAAEELRRVLA